MENKIVLELIKKDLEELAMLVDAMREHQPLSKSWIDLTLSKAQTLLSEFNLLQALPHSVTEPAPLVHSEIPVEALTDSTRERMDVPNPVEGHVNHNKDVFPEIKEVIIKDESQSDEARIETETQKNDEVQEPVVLVASEDKKDIELAEQKPMEITGKENQVLPEMEKVPASDSSEEFFEVKEKKVLGELFTKEPSLNEKLAMNKSLDTKIKARPVHSLKSAIGINDKFLYMRELFANDNKTFEHAVNHIDQVENLAQAIEYLEGNFKWQKTETSLKFLDLIKRRFEN